MTSIAIERRIAAKLQIPDSLYRICSRCSSSLFPCMCPHDLRLCFVLHAATPLYEFLTRLCAIVGGLFTVFSMFNAVADGAIKTFKSSIGKSS